MSSVAQSPATQLKPIGTCHQRVSSWAWVCGCGGERVNSMGERMRVEAREPILDRMPLAYNLAWRATSARPPSARRGAHVSERFAGRAIPVLSNASPAPRLPAVPSRESPSSRVPSALPSSACRFGWRHPLVEGSPADGSLSRAGDDCGGVVVKRSAASTNEVGRLPSRVRSDMPHAPRKRGW